MNETNKAKHKRNLTLAVGAAAVLLALIGLLTVLSSCVHLAERLLDNSAQKEKFEQLLFPVVMFDLGEVSQPEEMDQLVLLRSSIWSAFVSNMDKYTLDSSNRITVAKSDVDVACAKLFGPEIQLEHQSFSDYLNIYYYDEERESYLAPMDGDSVLYTPRVEEIEKSGVIYTLTVGYMESGNEWLESLQGRDYEPTPDKYMIYTVMKVNDHYQLLSIAYPEEGAVPGKPVYQLPQSSEDSSLPNSDKETPQENTTSDDSNQTV